jgi:hypothetical protein
MRRRRMMLWRRWVRVARVRRIAWRWVPIWHARRKAISHHLSALRSNWHRLAIAPRPKIAGVWWIGEWVTASIW